MFTPDEYEFLSECVDLRESKTRQDRLNKAAMIQRIDIYQKAAIQELNQKPDEPEKPNPKKEVKK